MTVERCRIYFRSGRRYLQLYEQGVQGPDIPEAMRQMRKHRKHREGGLHPEDQPESQRGKHSQKRARMALLEQAFNQ